jgi:hypothetical protein
MTMSLAADLRSLWCALHDLRDDVLPLRLLVNEDKPEILAPQPVGALSDGLDDVFGRLAEAIESLSPALGADTTPRLDARTTQALGGCHRSMLEFGREWTAEVNSYQRLGQLTRSAVARGPQWRTWAKSAVEGVTGCDSVIYGVNLSLLACWESLAELAGGDQSPCPSAAKKER